MGTAVRSGSSNGCFGSVLPWTQPARVQLANERRPTAQRVPVWLLPNDGSRTNHRLRRDMRRFDLDHAVDIAIIGCGAGGSVLAQRLARRGWDVVALDAGPFWDPDKDWVSDEAGSHQLYWNEPRVLWARTPSNSATTTRGRGVGGSMVHFAGYAPRFHPSDFRTFTNDGVGADWPIDYHDLKVL